MPKTPFIAATGLILWGLSPGILAADCPTTGVPLIVKDDGEVIATFNGKSEKTVFYSNLYLESPDGTSTFLFNNFTSTVGSSIPLGHFKAATELIFRLHVTTDEGKLFDFYTGLESRNPDGLPHARVTPNSPTDALVEFEDLLKLPECKKKRGFNDLSFTFSNVQAAIPPDRFLSYRAKAVVGTPKFQPIKLALADRVGAPGSFKIGKTVQLASPTSFQGNAVNSPELSLQRYTILRKPKQIHKRWRVRNELGRLMVRVRKADSVLIPAAVTQDTTVDPLTLDRQGIVDPLTCYSVQLAKKSAKFKKKKVQVEAVLAGTARKLLVKKPTHLCTPAEKDGIPAKHPQIHLMCYAVAPTKGQPKYRKTRVTAQSTIEPLSTRFKTRKETELCLPSTLDTP